MRYGTLAALLGLGLVVLAGSAWAGDCGQVVRSYTPTPCSPCVAPDQVYRATTLRQAPENLKDVRVTLAAYGWAASIEGTSWDAGDATDIDIPFEDLKEALDHVFMGYAEIQVGRWSFAVDSAFLAVEKDLQDGDVPLTYDYEQSMIDLRLGYTVCKKQIGSSQWGSCCYPRYYTFDVVLGARYWDVEQGLGVTGGPGVIPKTSSEWWDPYVGLRFRWAFAKRWFARVYGDVGGFDIGEDQSKLTWQVQAGIGFNIARWLHIYAGYRVIDLDRVDEVAGIKNGLDAMFHGPVVGFGITF